MRTLRAWRTRSAQQTHVIAACLVHLVAKVILDPLAQVGRCAHGALGRGSDATRTD